jgi:hypothetical protein
MQNKVHTVGFFGPFSHAQNVGLGPILCRYLGKVQRASIGRIRQNLSFDGCPENDGYVPNAADSAGRYIGLGERRIVGLHVGA